MRTSCSRHHSLDPLLLHARARMRNDRSAAEAGERMGGRGVNLRRTPPWSPTQGGANDDSDRRAARRQESRPSRDAGKASQVVVRGARFSPAKEGRLARPRTWQLVQHEPALAASVEGHPVSVLAEDLEHLRLGGKDLGATPKTEVAGGR